jgi:hypothetical protein
MEQRSKYLEGFAWIRNQWANKSFQRFITSKRLAKIGDGGSKEPESGVVFRNSKGKDGLQAGHPCIRRAAAAGS